MMSSCESNIIITTNHNNNNSNNGTGIGNECHDQGVPSSKDGINNSNEPKKVPKKRKFALDFDINEAVNEMSVNDKNPLSAIAINNCNNNSPIATTTTTTMTISSNTSDGQQDDQMDLSEWIGCRVLAKTSQYIYQRGMIQCHDPRRGIGVEFDNKNDNKNIVYYNPKSTDIIGDCCPLPGQIRCGMRIVAKCTDDGGFREGIVEEIQDNTGQGISQGNSSNKTIYLIKFNGPESNSNSSCCLSRANLRLSMQPWSEEVDIEPVTPGFNDKSAYEANSMAHETNSMARANVSPNVISVITMASGAQPISPSNHQRPSHPVPQYSLSSTTTTTTTDDEFSDVDEDDEIRRFSSSSATPTTPKSFTFKSSSSSQLDQQQLNSSGNSTSGNANATPNKFKKGDIVSAPNGIRKKFNGKS